MHFLGRVSLDLPSLRRISAKLKLQKPTTPEDNGSDDNGPDELDLLEEEYTVLTLSENVARKSTSFLSAPVYLVLSTSTLVLHDFRNTSELTMFQITLANFRTGASQRES